MHRASKVLVPTRLCVCIVNSGEVHETIHWHNDACGERLAQLNVDWEKRGLSSLWKEQGVPDLAARFGIHTGQVVAGNLGSPQHMKYAVSVIR